LAKHKKAETVALLIDEAQNLSDEMFEDIRFLSNIETETEKLLQIVLTGQPELETRLDQVHLRHIRQRVVVHCRLAALKTGEVGRYIAVRLREAGYEGGALFPPDVVGTIAFYSEGIPRLINIICDNALLLAYAQSQSKVSSEMIQEVVRDLGLVRPAGSTRASPAEALESGDRAALGTIGSAEALDPQSLTISRHRIGIALIPAGVTMALVAIGSAGGSFSSWPIKDYFQQPAAPEHGSIVAQHPADKFTPSLPSNAQLAAARRNDRIQKSPRVTSGATGAGPVQPAAKNSPGAIQQKQPRLGTFQVTGSTSFVRSRARADGKIIASLPPGTQVKVISVRGNYFRVEAEVEHQKIRGYVHRQDAFFERIPPA
jgi:hypothetical protein